MSDAAAPYSFCWNEPGALEGRAIELVRSMAAVKCKNKYPVGVIGAEARAHYTEARRIASAIEARSDATPKSDAAEGESAVGAAETPMPKPPNQSRSGGGNASSGNPPPSNHGE